MCLAIAKYKGVLVPRDYLATAMRANPDGAGFAYHEDGLVHIVKGFTKIEDFLKAWEPHEQKSAIIHFRWTTHGSNTRANCHPFELADGALIHNGIIGGMGDSKYDFSPSPSTKFGPIIGPSSGRKYDRYGTLKERKDLIVELIHVAHGLKDDKRGWATASVLFDDEFVQAKGVNEHAKYVNLLDEYLFVIEDQKNTVERDLRSDTREFCEDYLAGWTEDMLRKGKKMIEKVIGGGSKLATLHNSGRIQLFNENSGHWNEGAWYSNGCYKAVTSVYSGHIPSGGGSAYSGRSVAVGQQSGPVRTYKAGHDGKLTLVEEKPAKKESGAEVVELRPAKDSHRSAFLDTMIDGLLENNEDASELSSQRDWLSEFPHLSAMSLYEGE